MTRNEFMAALRRRLDHLPPEEQDAALKYYEEYFDEAASEEEAAQQLGSPDAIADRILSDYAPPAAASPKKEGRSALYWTGIVLLCVFASPFLLSLGAAALGVALGLAACVLAALVCAVAPFFALSLAFLCCFFALLWAGAVAMPAFMPGGLLLMGAALLCGGLGLLNGVFTGYLCYWIGLLFKKIFSSRKRKKEARAK